MPSAPSYDIDVKLKGAQNVINSFKSIKKEGDTVTSTMTRMDGAGNKLTQSIRTYNTVTKEAVTTTQKFKQSNLDMAATWAKYAAAVGIVYGALQTLGAGYRMVSGLLNSVIAESAEATRIHGQQAAVLRSTGAISGQTAKSLNDYASAMQRVGHISDDAVTATQNVLLKFKNLQGETFPQVTQAVLDYATATNQGAVPSTEELAAAAEKLGKALNQPAEAGRILRGVGIQLSEQQKELLAELVRTGRGAEAQQMILAELSRMYGGSAAEAVEHYAGATAQAKNATDELKESVGGIITDSALITATINDWSQAMFGFSDNVNGVSGSLTYMLDLMLGAGQVMTSWAKDAGEFMLNPLNPHAFDSTGAVIARVLGALGRDRENAGDGWGGDGGGSSSWGPPSIGDYEFNTSPGKKAKTPRAKAAPKYVHPYGMGGWGDSPLSSSRIGDSIQRGIFGIGASAMRASGMPTTSAEGWADWALSGSRAYGSDVAGGVAGAFGPYAGAMGAARAFLGGTGGGAIRAMQRNSFLRQSQLLAGSRQSGWGDADIYTGAGGGISGYAGLVAKRYGGGPSSMDKLNKAFGADGLMSIAGSDNYLQSAFQLAGGAIGGPIGGFLGGGIARTLKGLFGGGGKEDRGLEPSKPIYTSDVQLTERITQFLNIALPMLAKGGGLAIDRATGQLPTFGASANGVR